MPPPGRGWGRRGLAAASPQGCRAAGHAGRGQGRQRGSRFRFVQRRCLSASGRAAGTSENGTRVSQLRDGLIGNDALGGLPCGGGWGLFCAAPPDRCCFGACGAAVKLLLAQPGNLPVWTGPPWTGRGGVGGTGRAVKPAPEGAGGWQPSRGCAPPGPEWGCRGDQGCRASRSRVVGISRFWACRAGAEVGYPFRTRCRVPAGGGQWAALLPSGDGDRPADRWRREPTRRDGPPGGAKLPRAKPFLEISFIYL